MSEPRRLNRSERRAAEVAARETAMSALNFKWEHRMIDNTTMRVLVTHKLSGKTWERTATEESWPRVRADLLATIEADLNPEGPHEPESHH